VAAFPIARSAASISAMSGMVRFRRMHGLAEHLPVAGVEKIYDLTFDCHRHGMQSLLQRSVTQPPRESL
jgi:hypothetical protein